MVHDNGDGRGDDYVAIDNDDDNDGHSNEHIAIDNDEDDDGHSDEHIANENCHGDDHVANNNDEERSSYELARRAKMLVPIIIITQYQRRRY